MGAAGENQLINFTKGVEVIKTTKDLNLYRYFGGTVTDIGPYLSNGPIGRFIDRRGLALKPEWNNTMEGLAEIQVPKGTIMMKGTAKSQGGQWIGGRTQYFTVGKLNRVK